MEVLGSAFFQRALLAGLLVSVACGVVGTYVVVKEIASISGGLAHAAFGGLGLGYFLGFAPMLGAAGFGLAAGVGIGLADRRMRQGIETLVMMVWSVGMALGLLFVAAVPGYAPDLTSYLFGNLLFVSPTYLWIAAVLDLLLLGVVVVLGRQLQGVAFDEDFAESVGLPVDGLVVLLLGLVSVVVVLLIRVVGVLLVVALLTIPAAAARHWAASMRRTMVLAFLASAGSIVGGLFLSYGLSAGAGIELPTGPLVVLVAAAGFGVSAWCRPRSRATGDA